MCAHYARNCTNNAAFSAPNGRRRISSGATHADFALIAGRLAVEPLLEAAGVRTRDIRSQRRNAMKTVFVVKLDGPPIVRERSEPQRCIAKPLGFLFQIREYRGAHAVGGGARIEALELGNVFHQRPERAAAQRRAIGASRHDETRAFRRDVAHGKTALAAVAGEHGQRGAQLVEQYAGVRRGRILAADNDCREQHRPRLLLRRVPNRISKPCTDLRAEALTQRGRQKSSPVERAEPKQQPWRPADGTSASSNCHAEWRAGPADARRAECDEYSLTHQPDARHTAFFGP